MRTTLLPLALLVGCADDPGGPDLPTNPRLNGMLDAHNAVRAGAQPTPDPPLEPMRWSSALEQDAIDHASACRFEHDTELGALEQGENLAAWSAVDVSTAQDAVDGWAGEDAFYDYDTNGCTGVCGHYTQIVWRDSVELGCAVQACPDGLEGWAEGKEIWVCRYSPPGNYVDQRPY